MELQSENGYRWNRTSVTFRHFCVCRRREMVIFREKSVHLVECCRNKANESSLQEKFLTLQYNYKSPIGPPENKVPAVPVQPLLLGAKHLIHKGNDLSRHLDAPGGRTAALLESGFFLGREAAAPAGINSGAVGGVGGRGGQTLLPAAIAGIDQPPAGQRFKRRLVERGPAALTIGRLPRPPAQVPVQSQPD